MSDRILYLHGFASGPESRKGLAVAEHLARRSAHVERLDLRVPAPDALSVVAMIERAHRAIGGKDDRAILIGSSLGGFVSLQTAARDPRVVGLVLFAPAVGIAKRWRERLGEARWQQWMDSGYLPLPEHAHTGLTGVPSSFGLELEAIDTGIPTLSLPVAIAHGTRDDVVPVEGSRALAQQIPGATLLEVDDGHDLRDSIPALLEIVDQTLYRCSSQISPPFQT